MEFNVLGLGLWTYGGMSRFWGLGFRNWGLGFRSLRFMLKKNVGCRLQSARARL